MFEQSFVQATATTQRAAPVALSLLLQASVIGTGILIPLINPDLLPAAMMANTLLLTPHAPPPPPPPATPAQGRIARAPRQLRNGVLEMPTEIPSAVAEIDEPPDTAVATGVVGGTPNQMAGNSTWESLLNSIGREAAPPSAPPPVVTVKAPERPKAIIRHRIGGNVQEGMLVSGKLPDYPPIARSMRVEGKVVFQAVIGTTGTIQQLQLVSGHPLLVQAAMDAVRKWRYRPTMLNGDPIEVDTVISVTFTLNR